MELMTDRLEAVEGFAPGLSPNALAAAAQLADSLEAVQGEGLTAVRREVAVQQEALEASVKTAALQAAREHQTLADKVKQVEVGVIG